LADRELDILRDTLREHVGALTVDIGPRTPSTSNSLLRAANYIHLVFENAGLTATEQDYDYYDHDTLDFTFMAELVKSLELALLGLPPSLTNS
jgi:hypothetical protein